MAYVFSFDIIKISLMTSDHKTLAFKMHEVHFADKNKIKDNILSQIRGNRFYITFNRPKRYNAFSSEMYFSFAELLKYANQNNDIKFIIISGSGGNFSSGNDLSNFGNTEISSLGSIPQISRVTADTLAALNEAIINSRKPIFAITEGKVIGFAFTQLALYDRVFSVQNSQFNAPLVLLAQGPEMCASYTFPKIFGKSLGEDLIYKGTKVNSAFLQKYGFATSCKSRAAAEQALNKHLSQLDSLDWKSYVATRKLFKALDRNILLKVNKKECENLFKRWINPQLPRLMMQYMANVKSKSKL